MFRLLKHWLNNIIGLNVNCDLLGTNYRQTFFIICKILNFYKLIKSNLYKELLNVELLSEYRMNYKYLKNWLKILNINLTDNLIENILLNKPSATVTLLCFLHIKLADKDKKNFYEIYKYLKDIDVDNTRFSVFSVPELVNATAQLQQDLTKLCMVNKNDFSAQQALLDFFKEKKKSWRQNLMEKLQNTTKVYRNVISSENLVTQVCRDFINKSVSKGYVQESVGTPIPQLNYNQLLKLEYVAKKMEVPQPTPKMYTKSFQKIKNNIYERESLEITQEYILNNIFNNIDSYNKAELEKLIDKKYKKKNILMEIIEKKFATMNQLAELEYEHNKSMLQWKMCHDAKKQCQEIIDKQADKKAMEIELFQEGFRVLIYDIQQQYIAKVERRCEDALDFTETIIEETLNLVFHTISHKEKFGYNMPSDLTSEWRIMLMHGKANELFELPTELPDICTYLEKDSLLHIEDVETVRILREQFLEDYIHRNNIWKMKDISPDPVIKNISEIVYSCLEALHPKDPPIPMVNIPFLFCKALLLTSIEEENVKDEFLRGLTTLLRNKSIVIIQQKNAIDYCIEKYTNEKGILLEEDDAFEENGESYSDYPIMQQLDIEDVNSVGKDSKISSKSNKSGGKSKGGKSKKTKNEKDEKSKEETSTGGKSKDSISLGGKSKVGKSKEGKSKDKIQTSEEEFLKINQFVQTPTIIPEIVRLSETAMLGKYANNYIQTKELIPDELKAKIIATYICSYSNINGIVLVDYPRSLNEIRTFETVFTGEDPYWIDPDEYRLNQRTIRDTQLLDNPIGGTHSFKSYFTHFIRLKYTDKKMYGCHLDTVDMEQYNAIEKFYKNQEIFNYLEFNIISCDFLKFLARLVIGDFIPPVQPSKEAFGFEIEKQIEVVTPKCTLLNNKDSKKWLKPQGELKMRKDTKPLSVCKMIKTNQYADAVCQTSLLDVNECCQEEFRLQNNALPVKLIYITPSLNSTETDLRSTPLNTPKWSKDSSASLKVSDLKKLATDWIQLEANYCEKFLYLLPERKIQHKGLLVYLKYMDDYMDTFINRLSYDQRRVAQLQNLFNDLDDEMRKDIDGKHYLHYHVNDLKTFLNSQSENRKLESMEERDKFMRHPYIPGVLIIVANNALKMMYEEMLRSHKTFRMLNSYFSKQLRKRINFVIENIVELEYFELNLSEYSLNNNDFDIPIYFQDKPDFPQIPEISNTSIRSSCRESVQTVNAGEYEYEYEDTINNELLIQHKILIDKIIEKIKKIVSPTIYEMQINSIKYSYENNIRMVNETFIEQINGLFNKKRRSMSLQSASKTNVTKLSGKDSKKNKTDSQLKSNPENDSKSHVSRKSYSSRSSRRTHKNNRSTQSTPRNKKSRPSNSKNNSARSASTMHSMQLESNIPSSIQVNLEPCFTAINEETARILNRLDMIQSKAVYDIHHIIKYTRDRYEIMQEKIVNRFEREQESIKGIVLVFQMAIEEEQKLQYRIIYDQTEFIMQLDYLMFPDPPETTPPHPGDYPSQEIMTIEQIKEFIKDMQELAPSGYCPERTFAYYLLDNIGKTILEESPSLPRAWSRVTKEELELFLPKLYGSASHIDWRDFVLVNLNIPFPNIDELHAMKKCFFKYAIQPSIEIISKINFYKCTLWFEKNITDLNSTNENFRLKMIRDVLFELYKKSETTLNFNSLLLGLCKDALDAALAFGKALKLVNNENYNTDYAFGEKYVELMKNHQNYLKNERQVAKQLAENIIEEIGDKSFCPCPEKNGKKTPIVKKPSHEHGGIRTSKTVVKGIRRPRAFKNHEEYEAKKKAELYRFLKTQNMEICACPKPQETEVYKFHELFESPITDCNFWINLNIVLFVLEKVYPWHGTIVGERYQLIEGLQQTFKELKKLPDNTLINENNTVLCHHLLNHWFIKHWINTGLVFKACSPGELLLQEINNKQN